MTDTERFDDARPNPVPCCLHCFAPLRDHTPAELRTCTAELDA